MAFSAIIPLASRQISSRTDQEVFLRLAEEIQFQAATTNARSLELLELASEGLLQANEQSRAIELRKLITKSRAALVHGMLSSDADVVGILRCIAEAELRWTNTTRNNFPADTSVASPVNFRDIVRSAFRRVSQTTSDLFSPKWWVVTPESIRCSGARIRSATQTAYGLTSFNPDLSSNVRSNALSADAGLVHSFEIIQIAHDLRWYAAKVLPNRARSRFGFNPTSMDKAAWMMMSTWREIQNSAAAIRKSEAKIESLEKWRQGQAHGWQIISQKVREQSEQAAIWRDAALSRARVIRRNHPDRSLPKIAQTLAGEITLELGLSKPLNPETVYEFLRTADPALRRAVGRKS